jgi:hypothetical protein
MGKKRQSTQLACLPQAQIHLASPASCTTHHAAGLEGGHGHSINDIWNGRRPASSIIHGIITCTSSRTSSMFPSKVLHAFSLHMTKAKLYDMTGWLRQRELLTIPCSDQPSHPMQKGRQYVLETYCELRPYQSRNGTGLWLQTEWQCIRFDFSCSSFAAQPYVIRHIATRDDK